MEEPSDFRMSGCVEDVTEGEVRVYVEGRGMFVEGEECVGVYIEERRLWKGGRERGATGIRRNGENVCISG